MPKTVSPPSPDLHALAQLGAQLTLQQLAAERARIVALFPELRDLPTLDALPPTTRTYTRRATPPTARDHTHTCDHCARGFTPDSQHQSQKTCGRPACVRAVKAAYMRAYFAKRRAAAAAGVTS